MEVRTLDGPPAETVEFEMHGRRHALPFATLVREEHGFPTVDWSAVADWLEGLPDDAARDRATPACDEAWLKRLRQSLGERYRIHAIAGAAVVSPLAPRVAAASLHFMRRAVGRVAGVLEGIAHVPPWHRQILVVIEDDQRFFEYIARFYPETGEFSRAGGMYVHEGVGHYVALGADLGALEPVIVHETAHQLVSHLPIPLWINEGLAVNTECRLGYAAAYLEDAGQLALRHREHWTATTLDGFWTGASFGAPGDSTRLSYDLARILVEQLARDWPKFVEFVNLAGNDDAGLAAFRQVYGADLGEAALAAVA